MATAEEAHVGAKAKSSSWVRKQMAKLSGSTQKKADRPYQLYESDRKALTLLPPTPTPPPIPFVRVAPPAPRPLPPPAPLRRAMVPPLVLQPVPRAQLPPFPSLEMEAASLYKPVYRDGEAKRGGADLFAAAAAVAVPPSPSDPPPFDPYMRTAMSLRSKATRDNLRRPREEDKAVVERKTRQWEGEGETAGGGGIPSYTRRGRRERSYQFPVGSDLANFFSFVQKTAGALNQDVSRTWNQDIFDVEEAGVVLGTEYLSAEGNFFKPEKLSLILNRLIVDHDLRQHLEECEIIAKERCGDRYPRYGLKEFICGVVEDPKLSAMPVHFGTLVFTVTIMARAMSRMQWPHKLAIVEAQAKRDTAQRYFEDM